MQILLNGESRTFSGSTLADLIAELGLEQRTIAIELNLEVVPRSQHASQPLSEGDRVEIVHMIGGG